MFEHIQDREEEISLLKFAKREAACNKHNIQEARKLDPIFKKDKTVHKTKTKERTTIINGWIKEQKKLKKFFIKHQLGGNQNDYKRYTHSRKDNGKRDHFKSGVDSNS